MRQMNTERSFVLGCIVGASIAAAGIFGLTVAQRTEASPNAHTTAPTLAIPAVETSVALPLCVMLSDWERELYIHALREHTDPSESVEEQWPKK
jgi:hypothetical protein